MMLGDKQVAAPTISTSYGNHIATPMEGETVYIHPEGRFYTLEFKSPVTGEKFRESYPMMRACGGEVPVERARLNRKKNRYGEALYR